MLGIRQRDSSTVHHLGRATAPPGQVLGDVGQPARLVTPPLARDQDKMSMVRLRLGRVPDSELRSTLRPEIFSMRSTR